MSERGLYLPSFDGNEKSYCSKRRHYIIADDLVFGVIRNQDVFKISKYTE